MGERPSITCPRSTWTRWSSGSSLVACDHTRLASRYYGSPTPPPTRPRSRLPRRPTLPDRADRASTKHSAHRTPPSSRRPQPGPGGDCYFCQRFGTEAKRCGHNKPGETVLACSATQDTGRFARTEAVSVIVTEEGIRTKVCANPGLLPHSIEWMFEFRVVGNSNPS